MRLLLCKTCHDAEVGHRGMLWFGVVGTLPAPESGSCARREHAGGLREGVVGSLFLRFDWSGAGASRTLSQHHTLPTGSAIGDEIQRNVLVPTVGGDVDRRPAVPVGQPRVGAELDEQLDEFEVALHDALVKRRLALVVVEVNVERALPALQQPLQFAGVALLDGTLEDLLGHNLRLRHGSHTRAHSTNTHTSGPDRGD